MIDIKAVLSIGVSYAVSVSTDSDPEIDWYTFNIHPTIRDKHGKWFWERLDGTADNVVALYDPSRNKNIHIVRRHKNRY